MKTRRIYNFTPYCWRDEGDPIGCDLAHVYNEYMALLPNDDDWACLHDHDVMHTTLYWFRLVEEAIAQKPDAGAFTAVTNRLLREKSGWQMTDRSEHDPDKHDLQELRRVGCERFMRHGVSLVDVTDIEQTTNYKPMSGFFMVIQKRTWKAIGGWTPIEKNAGLLWLDWQAHRKIRALGKRIYLLPGLFLAHASDITRGLDQRIKEHMQRRGQ